MYLDLGKLSDEAFYALVRAPDAIETPIQLANGCWG